jgi:Rrf2 family transcriptional regulator, nitric oxide-sensitive transcriptional repressor
VQLSLHADYALRVLVYLGTHPDRIVTTREISNAYRISKNHLVRVVQTLAGSGYVDIHAGRSGGVTLAREPHMIRLGDVVRDTEPNLRLAECFDMETNTCPIVSVCGLKAMLNQALTAFLSALNQYTVADVLDRGNRHELANAFVTFAGWPATGQAPDAIPSSICEGHS